MTGETVLVDCPHCAARVEAKFTRDGLDHDCVFRLGLVKLLEFGNPLVIHQDFLGPVGPNGDEEYSDAQRIWPSPDTVVSLLIPDVIRASLEEARKCLSCGTNTASVAMTGRGIEGMCHYFKTKKASLFDGLKELLQREIIDKRLYQWADELRLHRNLAAHASGAP